MLNVTQVTVEQTSREPYYLTKRFALHVNSAIKSRILQLTFNLTIVLQVFLSQLHRRARLVNSAFQQDVASIILQHSCEKYIVERNASTDFKRVQSQDQQESKLTDTWDAKAFAEGPIAECGAGRVECLFSNGQRAAVEVRSAPVKSVLRMREKLVKCISCIDKFLSMHSEN